MADIPNPESIKLAYLQICTPIPNTYVGGLMVTDGRGLPVEFRYTEPIEPTRIQQILYGQVLSQYIKRDVILETLLKSVESNVSTLLVEDDAMLAADLKKVSVIRITETKSQPVGEMGTVQPLNLREFLFQNTPQGAPVRVLMKENPFPAGGGGGGNGTTNGSPATDEDEGAGVESNQAAIQPAELPADLKPLMEAGYHMDVCEPLKRIAKALEAICQEAGIQGS